MNSAQLLEKDEDVTKIEFDPEGTSLRNLFTVIKNDFDLDSSQEEILDSSVLESSSQEISTYENVWVGYKIEKEKEKLDRIIDELTRKLVVELRYFSTDDSETSSAEKEILDIEKKYSFRVLGEVLQRIYIQYNDYPNMLVGICKGLERFDLEEVMPWGPVMLSGLLMHKNEMVKEYAVSLVENWSDVDLLPMLRNLDCSSAWLKEYISDVVKYLETRDNDVLHKKVI